MSELQFPHAIDNSMLKELRKCQKIGHWKFERGLNSGGVNPDLLAGEAFAKGIEVMRKAYYVGGKAQEAALVEGINAVYEIFGGYVPPERPYKAAKTVEKTAGALAFYSGKFPFIQNEYTPVDFGSGKLGIEVSFNQSIHRHHPVSHKPLTYCGRFDMLATDKQGHGWVIDEKTTGKLGDAWVHQWDLDSGLAGYCWGAQKLLEEHNLDIEIKGAVINGVSILKHDFDHMRCPTFRQPWEIERWYSQSMRVIDRWIEAFKNQNHDMVLDHACALYNNPCQYAKLCKSMNPERIEESYVVKFWNPLERD